VGISLFIADELNTPETLELAIVVFEVNAEEELDDDEGEVNPESPVPRELVHGRFRAIDPNEERHCRRPRDRQMQRVYIAQRE